jgi:hypothetical protein
MSKEIIENLKNHSILSATNQISYECDHKRRKLRFYASVNGIVYNVSALIESFVRRASFNVEHDEISLRNYQIKDFVNGLQEAGFKVYRI